MRHEFAAFDHADGQRLVGLDEAAGEDVADVLDHRLRHLAVLAQVARGAADEDLANLVVGHRVQCGLSTKAC